MSEPSTLRERWQLWLWHAEDADLSAWQRTGRYTARVIYAVARDLVEGKITLHAMSLVYTTLLSIVPFLALSFSVLKGFGVHNQLRPFLEGVMTDPLGDRASPLIDTILQFVDNIEVGVLGSVGLGILIYTVIALVQKVERSFNEIWHVSQIRPLGQRFSNYLSVILVGPLLLFAALGATAAIVSSDMVVQATQNQAVSWLFHTMSRATPYVVIITLFTFLYVFIPNTSVNIKHAFIGGVVAGITWQTLGFGFTIFVAHANNYAAIYSGFAIGIFVLIWLYLVWLLLLIGAAVAFYSQHVRQITLNRGQPSAAVDEYTGMAMVYRIARAYEQGNALAISKLESDLAVSPDIVRRMISKLVNRQILTLAGSAGDRLVPARPLDRLTMDELLSAVRSAEQPLPAALVSDQAVASAASRINGQLTDVFGNQTVAEWIRESDTQS